MSLPSTAAVVEVFARRAAWCDRCGEQPSVAVQKDPLDAMTVLVGRHHGQVERHAIAEEVLLFGRDELLAHLRAALLFFWRGFFAYPRRRKVKPARRQPIHAAMLSRRRERQYTKERSRRHGRGQVEG